MHSFSGAYSKVTKYCEYSLGAGAFSEHQGHIFFPMHSCLWAYSKPKNCCEYSPRAFSKHQGHIFFFQYAICGVSAGAFTIKLFVPVKIFRTLVGECVCYIQSLSPKCKQGQEPTQRVELTLTSLPRRRNNYGRKKFYSVDAMS